jgi:intron-binding protein aquarius
MLMLDLIRVAWCALQLPPVVQNMALQKYAHLDQSLFTRFVRLGFPVVQLDKQGRARPGLCDLYRWRCEALLNGRYQYIQSRLFRACRYKELGDLELPLLKSQPVNAGMLHDFQFINVEDYQGKGEHTPTPYFYQNLGEAEYVVALYVSSVPLSLSALLLQDSLGC